MKKFVIEKEVATIKGCKLVLKKEADLINLDLAFLEIDVIVSDLQYTLNVKINGMKENG